MRESKKHPPEALLELEADLMGQFNSIDVPGSLREAFVDYYSALTLAQDSKSNADLKSIKTIFLEKVAAHIVDKHRDFSVNPGKENSYTFTINIPKSGARQDIRGFLKLYTDAVDGKPKVQFFYKNLTTPARDETDSQKTLSVFMFPKNDEGKNPLDDQKPHQYKPAVFGGQGTPERQTTPPEEGPTNVGELMARSENVKLLVEYIKANPIIFTSDKDIQSPSDLAHKLAAMQKLEELSINVKNELLRAYVSPVLKRNMLRMIDAKNGGKPSTTDDLDKVIGKAEGSFNISVMDEEGKKIALCTVILEWEKYKGGFRVNRLRIKPS